MPLAGVDHEEPRLPRVLQHWPRRRNRAAQLADIVTERFAEAAGLEKIALHVDDDERRSRRLEGEFVRLGFDRDQGIRPSNSASRVARKRPTAAGSQRRRIGLAQAVPLL
jgi:hypothetical protein